MTILEQHTTIKECNENLKLHVIMQYDIGGVRWSFFSRGFIRQ